MEEVKLHLPTMKLSINPGRACSTTVTGSVELQGGNACTFGFVHVLLARIILRNVSSLEIWTSSIHIQPVISFSWIWIYLSLGVNFIGIQTFHQYSRGGTKPDLLVPLYASADTMVLQDTVKKQQYGMPPTKGCDEDHLPVPHVVEIPCKLIFGIMLHDLGLLDARYTSHTHEDGKVSAIVTYYGRLEIPRKSHEKQVVQSILLMASKSCLEDDAN